MSPARRLVRTTRPRLADRLVMMPSRPFSSPNGASRMGSGVPRTPAGESGATGDSIGDPGAGSGSTARRGDASVRSPSEGLIGEVGCALGGRQPVPTDRRREELTAPRGRSPRPGREGGGEGLETAGPRGGRMKYDAVLLLDRRWPADSARASLGFSRSSVGFSRPSLGFSRPSLGPWRSGSDRSTFPKNPLHDDLGVRLGPTKIAGVPFQSDPVASSCSTRARSRPHQRSVGSVVDDASSSRTPWVRLSDPLPDHPHGPRPGTLY